MRLYHLYLWIHFAFHASSASLLKVLHAKCVCLPFLPLLLRYASSVWETLVFKDYNKSWITYMDGLICVKPLEFSLTLLLKLCIYLYQIFDVSDTRSAGISHFGRSSTHTWADAVFITLSCSDECLDMPGQSLLPESYSCYLCSYVKNHRNSGSLVGEKLN